MTNVILDQKAVAVMQEVVGGGSGSGIAIVDVKGKHFDPEAFLTVLIAKGVNVDSEDYTGDFSFGLTYDYDEIKDILVKKDSDAFVITINATASGRAEVAEPNTLRAVLTNATLISTFESTALLTENEICAAAIFTNNSNEVLTFNEEEVSTFIK